ncbi:conserved membrane protein of unknown function [Petrocella atlantisensis]|uniref:Lysine exporter LysO family protein n=1 Tax=Petrocella atlantisensis TaxID=2173034 RepID=A0A3P7PAY4_9FIRM|nr:lysine exporter LysO family protein [Petrocella atlantisensis]MCF8020090.1 lysine exporter LysO family protein [Vallitaleaceae bacterium]VDN47343.1 conserved membrane protein of unknown function [Petrocella atlantisensis]
MTWIIMLSVIIGALTGYLVFPSQWYDSTGWVIDIGLCLLLLFVGMDIGKQKNTLAEIKKIGFNILAVPLMIGLGSIFGALVFGHFVGLNYNESGAIGAGFGWYTLSAIMLVDYSSEISALAFLTNVIREVMAILMLPLIAKYIGHYEAVAPCGATAMDTTLPIIARYTTPKVAIVGFVSGVVLSSLVPLLVPIIINL